MFLDLARARGSMPNVGFVEDALVVSFVGGDDVVGAEFFLGRVERISIVVYNP
jgi:hypothetical protein